MNVYKHGGDIYRNDVTLDFSINVNPLGMPKEVMDAAIEGVKESGRYPDYACSRLLNVLVEKEGYKKEHVIFGNGAAELIFLLCQVKKPKRALLLAPTFSEYEQALLAVGCDIHYVMLKKEEGFAVGREVEEELKKGYDIFFLCNPNNPTGEVTKKDRLERLLSICKEQETLFVVDECFQEFLEEDDKASLIPYVKDHENLCIVKAFTKIYCMAGLRLGYLLTSNPSLITGIPMNSQPWRVSIPAQYAGVAALHVKEYLEETKVTVREERHYLKGELEKAGATCFASKANYIFFQHKAGLYEYLKGRGILIRSCANYRGLDETYYRVGIRKHEENEQLITAVNDFEIMKNI